MKRHSGSERLPPRGVPRRRPRHANAYEAARRLLDQPPQARPDRGPAGRPARRRLPAPHRPRRPGPWRPPDGEHPPVHRRRRSPDLDELVERDTLSRRGRPASSPLRCGPDRPIVFAGAPGSGKTTLLSCCVGELDPSLRGRHRRGGLRDRCAAAERGQHADPPSPPRPARHRPAPARRRVPPDGPRRGHRRRGPRPRGATASTSLTFPAHRGPSSTNRATPTASTSIRASP